MAHVSKDVITKARAALKVLNKQYGVKATLSGENTSSLKLTIAQGKIDFIGNYCENVLAKRQMQDTDGIVDWAQREMYIQVNQYYLDSSFSGIALEYLEKAKEIMYVDHWDKSDIMTDYFHCSYYVNIHIGRWNKGYVLAI